MPDPNVMVAGSGIPEGQRANHELLKQVVSDAVREEIEKRWKTLNEPQRRTASPEIMSAMRRQQTTDGKLPKGHGAARCVRYLTLAHNDPYRAIEFASSSGDKDLAEAWEKAMAQSILADGGALLPPQYSQEIIEELGAKAVVRKMGLNTLPMAGSLTLPYIDTSASAYYVGENTNATASQPTTGQLQLSEKTLVGLCPISNSLLRTGGPRVDQAIKNHMLRVVARKEDYTFIRSPGTANEPRGMLYQAQANNKFDANATVSVANVTTDLGKAVDKLMSGDVPLDRAGWIISPRTYRYLHQATDANSNRVWRDEMDKGLLEGFPFAVTSQIPENLNSVESEVYFAAFDILVLGESEGIEIAVFDGGAYYDGSSVVSGISQNQTVLRIIEKHDLGCQQRGKEIAVSEKVKWGT